MKTLRPLPSPRLIVSIMLAVAAMVSVGPNAYTAESPTDPAHAAHVASGAMPADSPKGNPALSQEVSQLRAKVAQLEAALANNGSRPQVAAPSATAPAAAPMPGMAAPAAMPGMPAPAAPMAGMGAPVAPMAGMNRGTPGTMKPAGGMSSMAAPAIGPANMMGMMDKMMGMMDKMMGMGGGAMPPAAPMAGGGMGMMPGDMGGMGGGSAMPMPAPAPAAGMSGGGMGMDKMEMAGMMGMGSMNNGGAAGTMPQSALPGFAGASHLYHIGATDFFLDHPQHIALTTEQQAALNQAKERALLTKSTADRAVAQAEQELWTLTAADQPNGAAIGMKIAEIGKITGDARLAFIRAVGEASALLTDQQRQSLTGFAPPAPAAPAMAGGMSDM